MSLIIKNLKKSYHQGDENIEILRGLNAEIGQGRIVAIVGRSGSGKSTLLSLLAGLEGADSGRIEIDGTDITGLSEKELTDFRARRISIVFQQYHLVSHLTALENVMLPLEILGRDQAREKATALLKRMGLEHRLHHVPGKMSGGECQRVAIARALVVEPKILLADEPSGNLDTDTGDKVMDLFFEMARSTGITTILVTHSESLAARCQQILRLSHGQFEVV
ncbi:MAG: ABC transporter ATP-binding protein [Bdellovibrionaceae bacterium]|nr:ABC transporter ATP-binding protein [Pseudobdellovibrionaceae bacterium]MBX3034518.1 ABC transporter ATP-binding protein [Pseudobdellovibrionaceae bacterium]